MARTRGIPKSATTTTDKLQATRSSTRSSKVTKTNKTRKSTEEIARAAIETIRDFKKVKGNTYYLVQRAGSKAPVWEASSESLLSDQALQAFHDRVQTTSGYDINGTTSSRPSRTSKTRAMLRFQPTAAAAPDADDDDDSDSSMDVRQERGTAKKRGRSTKASAPNAPKKLRGIAARKAQAAEAREQRINERANWDDKDVIDMDESNCCLRCKTQVYRQVVRHGSVRQMKALLEDLTKVPHWSKEDCQHWSDLVLNEALVKGRTDMIDLLVKDEENKRVEVPSKYMAYGSTTGYVSRYTFGHAVSKVNESRGNRQGDSAFFRYMQRSILELDINRLNESMNNIALLAGAQNPDTPASVSKFITQFGYAAFWEGKGFYFTVASGNWEVAGKLIEDPRYRTGLNHLHVNVLNFKEDKELESYRRNQILKKAYEAANITPVQCAAIHPSNKFLKELFEQLTPAETAELDEYGRTIAHFAAASQTPDCLQYLIDKEFSVITADKFRITPLIQAARFGRHHNIRPLITCMSKGEYPATEFADQTMIRQKWRALHYAAYFGHPDTCRALIDAGATVDAMESSLRTTPLGFAAQRGHLECVKVLIEYGKADPEFADKFGRTPLHVASINGHYDVAKYLVCNVGVDANTGDTSENRPAHYAAGFGYLKLLRLLIEGGGADPAASNVWRTTPCSVANLKGHVAIVEHLLTAYSIDVNFKDQDGKTLLHCCAVESITQKLDIEQIKLKARLLISKRANPNLKTIEGDTVLHSLAQSAYFIQQYPSGWVLEDDTYAKPLTLDHQDGIECQRFLATMAITAGADLESLNQNGETPLATAMRHGNTYIMEELVRNGANYWDIKDCNGNTFFHHLLRLAAELDTLPARRPMDITANKRRAKTIENILEAIDNDGAKEVQIDATNDEGYPAMIYGVMHAIDQQRARVKEEKARIKRIYHTASSNYSKATASNDDTSMIREDAVFEFRFDHFMAAAEEIIQRHRPNMKASVQLPKDFFKKNPNRPKSEYPEKTGWSALHFASLTQDSNLLNFLMRHGCDPNQIVEGDGNAATGTAMLRGYFIKTFRSNEYLPSSELHYIEHAEKLFNIIKPDFKMLLPNAVKQYLHFGANPCVGNKDGFSPLMKAAELLDKHILQDMCNAITLSNFSNIDACCETTNRNALMYAIDALENKRHDANIDVSSVTHLVSAGANPNMQYPDDHADTIFMKALRLGIPSLVDTILVHTKHPICHSTMNNMHETSSIIASKQNNRAIADLYFQSMATAYAAAPFDTNGFDRQGNNALTVAAKANNEYAVSILLKCNADPNKVADNIHESPLSQAVACGFINVAKILLDSGADVNWKDKDNMTPLHKAVLAEKYPLVKLLLENGADIHAVNKQQRTALHLAVQQTKTMTNASLRIERVLLDAGADINATDILGRTALHIAFTNMDVIPHMQFLEPVAKKTKELLKERNAQAQVERESERLVTTYGHPNAAGTNAWIRQAVIKYHEEKKRANEENSNDKENIAPSSSEELEALQKYALMQWELDVAVPTKADPIDIIRFLCNYRGSSAQLDICDEFGRTALHYAAMVGAFSSTSIMLQHGADLNAKDLDSNTPLQLALRYKHVDYSVMLCNQGATVGNDMTIPGAKPVSTLKYSLSQDFMNMAYVILEQNPNTLESLRDALRTGKFHVADILMSTAEVASLSGTIQDGQNMWHIIADFTPFNEEIWNEYLPDFLTRISQLNITLGPDSHGRTPAHYAAKNGQTALLKHLLQLNVTINSVDNDGLSELWYAVSSDSVECVQTLLHAGANVTLGTSTQQHKSIVWTATSQSNAAMLHLLLNAGAPTDQDSQYGRSNAIMKACIDKNEGMLKLLLDAGANPDTPSTYILNAATKKTTTIAPVFIATGSLFKLMIERGANANVVSPNVKPFKGKSCFMHRYGNDEELDLMIRHNVNVNLTDDHSPRSIFYHFFFGNKSQGTICTKILKHSKPEVNDIDPITGMTPLEHAIRKHDAIKVERLMELGANPNVVSCWQNPTASAVDLFDAEPVNAIFHAVAQNHLVILQTICRLSKYPIKWTATNSQGQTVVTFIAASPYSPENIEVLKFIDSAIPDQNDWIALATKKDTHGMTAMDYAKARKRKELYHILVDLEVPKPKQRRMIEDDGADAMDIDQPFIALQSVEEDADAERAILDKEAEQRATRKKNSAKEDIDYDSVHEIDSYSKLEKVGRLLLDDNKEPYDIMLQKVDIGASYYGCNMFYKLSIIYNTVLDVYVLWTRWGSFGEEGMHQKTPFLTKDEAVAEFRSIFRSKSGNVWEDHKPESFVAKPGRFELIRAKQKKKLTILEDFKFMDSAVASQLPQSIYGTMRLFCNFKALQDGYRNIDLDIPAGQIPQSSIDTAYSIIEEARTVMQKYQEAGSSVLTKEKNAERKQLAHQLVQLSNKYYRLLPPTNEKKGITPLRNKQTIDKEMARLNTISYFTFSSNVILAAKRRASEIHPLDYCYRALNCRLNEIDDTSLEYKMVKKYMLTTADRTTYEIANLFSIDRAGEAERFDSISNKSNCKLLWHGSHTHNFLGLLKQGLRTKPSSTVGGHSGSMFGDGIYFADTFAKSVNYSSRGAFEMKHPGYSLLLLCEVNLGNECAMTYHNTYEFERGDYQSVKGLGINGPNPDNIVYDKNGIAISVGPNIKYDYSSRDYWNRPQLNHSEYIVYDEARVKLRYLVVVRDTEYCTLCQSHTASTCKELSKHKLEDDFTYHTITEYEAWLLRFQLSHANKKVKDVFDDKLDEYIRTRQYEKYWLPVEPLTRDSRVCKSCVNKMATTILVQEMFSKLPNAVQNRPVCKFGIDCKMSGLQHAKRFQHWFHPNSTKEEEEKESADEDEDYVESDHDTSMDEDEDESMDESD